MLDWIEFSRACLANHSNSVTTGTYGPTNVIARLSRRLWTRHAVAYHLLSSLIEDDFGPPVIFWLQLRYHLVALVSGLSVMHLESKVRSTLVA